MPDCELPRVACRPSLGVAELDDGTMALVAIRDIAAGENFSVAPSDSEESEEEEEPVVVSVVRGRRTGGAK